MGSSQTFGRSASFILFSVCFDHTSIIEVLKKTRENHRKRLEKKASKPSPLRGQDGMCNTQQSPQRNATFHCKSFHCVNVVREEGIEEVMHIHINPENCGFCK